MATNMHRLQISIPEWQAQFLTERARRAGVSIAEVVRRLVQREAAIHERQSSVEALWAIAGCAEDPAPLVDGTPVSENPELYLTGPAGTRGSGPER